MSVTPQQDQSDGYKRFGRHVGIIFLMTLLMHLLSLVRLPILTKGLGATLYGTWTLINTTVSLVVPFASIALGTSIVRFLAAETDRDRIRDDFLSACATVLVSGSLFAVLLAVVARPLAIGVFGGAANASFIRIASVLIALRALHLVPLGYFRMRRRIGLYASANFAHQALQVGLIAGVVLLGHGLMALISVVILSEVLFGVGVFFLAVKETGFRIPSFSPIKRYLKWGIPLTPNAAILWIIHVSDRYIVSHLMGVANAGIYNAAYAIGSYAGIAVMPLLTVLYPNVVKTYDEGVPSETQRYLKHSFRLLMLLSVPAAFGLSILARPLMALLTTTEFVSGSSVIPFIAVGNILFALYQIPISIVHLVNRTHITVCLLGTSAVVNIGLNFALIPHLQLLGAAVATLVAYGILGVLTLVITRRYLRFDLSPVFLLKVVSSSVVMALGVWLLRPASIGTVILAIAAGILIYSVMIVATGAITKEERSFLFALARDTFGKARSLLHIRKR